jgi:hypothetical protein
MLRFKKNYFLLAILLFIVEVLIAMYMHDSIIRPYGGDYLVVMLIYCFVKAFWNAPVTTVAISVLIFSYLIEFLQYFKFVRLLGLANSHIANVVLGNSFAWTDMIAYTLGIVAVLLVDKIISPVKAERPIARS